MPVTTVTESETKKTNKKTNSTQQKGGGGTPQTNSFSKLLNMYGSNLTLDGNADEYLSKLRKILEDPAYKIKVNCKRLSENGAYAFNSPNAGVVILFMSAVDSNVNDIINRTKLVSAAQSFKNEFPNHKLLNVIQVTEADYEKYVQMAAYITNTLQMVSDSAIDDLTIDMLKKYKIIIDNDTSSVKSFFKKNYPHKVIPRCDTGFTVSIGVKKNNQFIATNNIYDSFDSVMPLFAASGYTDFLEENVMPGTPLKFTPVVHLSGILSVIPSSKILSMAIPIAAEIFIGNGIWKQQFLNPTKGGVNIGNLINDQKTNKPWNAKQQNEIIGFFNNYINPAFLVVDVVEGQARIPGIERMIINSNDDRMSLINEITSFLKIDPSNIQPNLGKIIFSEIIGEVEVEKEISPDLMIDSRMFDYLFLVSKLGYQEKLESLKHRYIDPVKRADFISEFANFNKTNINYAFLIDSMFAKICAMAIGQSLSFYNPSMNVIPTVSLAQQENPFNFQTNMFGNANSNSPAFPGWNIYG